MSLKESDPLDYFKPTVEEKLEAISFKLNELINTVEYLKIMVNTLIQKENYELSRSKSDSE